MLVTELFMVWLASGGSLFPTSGDPFNTPEFTPACNECVHLLTFGAETPNVYFEVYLSDVTHPEGKRLVYKGPSGETFLTVSGAPVASIRTCGGGYACSDFVEQVLAPSFGRAMPENEGSFRISDPVELIHLTGAKAEPPPVSASIRNPQAVEVDLTATGQRGCKRGIGKRRWNIGGRMQVGVSENLEFEVRNLSVVEHGDGYWTWSGNIIGNGSGTVTITANDCAHVAFVSIDSSAGKFGVRPSASASHVLYEIDAGTDAADCDMAFDSPANTLISSAEVPPPHDRSLVTDDRFRRRYIEVDYSGLLSIWPDFLLLNGEDRHHNSAWFVEPRGRLELAPGLAITADLRCGTLLASHPGYEHWSGHLPGHADARYSFSFSAGQLSFEARNLAAVYGIELLFAQHVEDDLFELTEVLD